MQKIKVGIIGAAGYTGGELVRLLVHHPQASIAYAYSKTFAGQPVTNHFVDLIGDTTLVFENSFHFNIDVLFLCVGHTEAKQFLQQNSIPKQVRIIDLSQDYRLLSEGNTYQGETFIYGLSEWNKNEIKNAKYIANPGCFATCIQLALLPLVKFIAQPVHINATTGSTGAGASLSPSSHFSYRQNNLSSYKTFQHQHIAEINQSLRKLETKNLPLYFVPNRGAFTRGIYCTMYTATTHSESTIRDFFVEKYNDDPFVHITTQEVNVKQAVNTNKCIISIQKINDQIVITSVIDNLLKGASGQAVQNMNMMMGINETDGLQLKAIVF